VPHRPAPSRQREEELKERAQLLTTLDTFMFDCDGTRAVLACTLFVGRSSLGS
jgi:hypothetical protein